MRSLWILFRLHAFAIVRLRSWYDFITDLLNGLSQCLDVLILASKKPPMLVTSCHYATCTYRCIKWINFLLRLIGGVSGLASGCECLRPLAPNIFTWFISMCPSWDLLRNNTLFCRRVTAVHPCVKQVWRISRSRVAFGTWLSAISSPTVCSLWIYPLFDSSGARVLPLTAIESPEVID